MKNLPEKIKRPEEPKARHLSLVPPLPIDELESFTSIPNLPVKATLNEKGQTVVTVEPLTYEERLNAYNRAQLEGSPVSPAEPLKLDEDKIILAIIVGLSFLAYVALMITARVGHEVKGVPIDPCKADCPAVSSPIGQD